MAVAKKMITLADNHEFDEALLIERLGAICGALEDRRIVYGSDSGHAMMTEIQELLSELFEIPFAQAESVQIIMDSNVESAVPPN